MQTEDNCYIYWNELDKACLHHDVAYGSYKELIKRAQCDKGLRDKAFKIAGNWGYYCYERGLTSVVYKCFDEKSVGSGVQSLPS